MVFAPGYTTLETVAGHPKPDTDWENLQLVLHEGEYASYTCRSLEAGLAVSLRYRTSESCTLSLYSGSTLLKTITLSPSEALTDSEAVALPAAQFQTIRVSVESGSVILSDLCIL